MKLTIHGSELILSEMELFSADQKNFSINLQTINDALKRNSQLTSLNFSENHLGDIEIKLLLPILTSQKQITSVNLSNNHIGNSGAKAIQNFLEVINESLTSLDLSSNDLLLDDLELLHALCKQKGLKIKLDNNLGSREGLIGPLAMTSIKVEGTYRSLVQSLGRFFSTVNDSPLGSLTRDLSSQNITSNPEHVVDTDTPPSDSRIRDLPHEFKRYGTF
jgi:Leucine Rich repeat